MMEKCDDLKRFFFRLHDFYEPLYRRFEKLAYMDVELGDKVYTLMRLQYQESGLFLIYYYPESYNMVDMVDKNEGKYKTRVLQLYPKIEALFQELFNKNYIFKILESPTNRRILKYPHIVLNGQLANLLTADKLRFYRKPYNKLLPRDEIRYRDTLAWVNPLFREDEKKPSGQVPISLMYFLSFYVKRCEELEKEGLWFQPN